VLSAAHDTHWVVVQVAMVVVVLTPTPAGAVATVQQASL